MSTLPPRSPRPVRILLEEETSTYSVRDAPTSPIPGMVDLVLSPLQDQEENEMDDDVTTALNLLPLCMTDSARGDRPLPSLHAPLMYRDVPFAGLFMIHLILMLLVTTSIRAENVQQEQKSDRHDVVGGVKDSRDSQVLLLSLEEEEDYPDVGVALRSLCVVNLLFALGWQLLFIFYAKLRFVQVSCVFSIVGLSVLACTLLILGSHNDGGVFWGGVCAGVVVLELVWFLRSNHGLDFVAVFFELVVDFLMTHPSLGYATCTTLLAYTVWASWICTTLEYVGRDVSPWGFRMLYLVFHFYWMSNMLKNIITIVASGTTLIWYYHDKITDRDSRSDDITDHAQQDQRVDYLDRKVVMHYARCALSSSFGSICIGSLLCPLAHLVWNALRWARRDESVLPRRFSSLRSERVEHFIRTYHKYSFVHIAGYNKPYYVAAHDAWKLIEHHGVEAIVDEDLTSRILLLGGNGWAGVMSALTASALGNASSHATFFTLASFTLCYTTISLATQVTAAVIKTLFVCFAENPERLSQLHPLIYHRFVRLAELKSFRDHKAPVSTRA